MITVMNFAEEHNSLLRVPIVSVLELWIFLLYQFREIGLFPHAIIQGLIQYHCNFWNFCVPLLLLNSGLPCENISGTL
jgi:hypothetical protein